MRQTLSFGGRYGVFIGLSAACADVVYGAVAAFGVNFIAEFVTVQQHWMRLATGLLMLTLGVKVFRSKWGAVAQIESPRNHVGVFAATFALTITNPLTLFA